MNIEIDYNPSPKKTFFISVETGDGEAISFDYTSKGRRIIKQILVERKPFPKKMKPTAEWDAIVIENKKFVKKYHVKWIDMDEKDWVNNEIWKTVRVNPLPEKLKNELLRYSRLFSDHYKKLENFSKEWGKFETLLSNETRKFKNYKI